MNQYRCETCGFKQNLGDDETPVYYCNKAAEINVILQCPMADAEFMGCASHSDFQSERDKVLDKFEAFAKYVYTQSTDSQLCDSALSIRDEIKELRQVKE